jgi:putative long chain acyl-CoA synthase
VFGAAVNDAASRVGAVDLAVTYRVAVNGHDLAVSALTLSPGGSVPTADLNEALAVLPVGAPPDVIHVVPEMKLSATYRPLLAPLRAAGLPKSSRYAWYLDHDTGVYRRFTAAVRAELTGTDPDERSE